jgi:hypothetical protein
MKKISLCALILSSAVLCETPMQASNQRTALFSARASAVLGTLIGITVFGIGAWQYQKAIKQFGTGLLTKYGYTIVPLTGTSSGFSADEQKVSIDRFTYASLIHQNMWNHVTQGILTQQLNIKNLFGPYFDQFHILYKNFHNPQSNQNEDHLFLINKRLFTTLKGIQFQNNKPIWDQDMEDIDRMATAKVIGTPDTSITFTKNDFTIFRQSVDQAANQSQTSVVIPRIQGSMLPDLLLTWNDTLMFAFRNPPNNQTPLGNPLFIKLRKGK